MSSDMQHQRHEKIRRELRKAMPKMTISARGERALEAVFEHTLHLFFHENGDQHWDDPRCKSLFRECAAQIGRGAQSLADHAGRGSNCKVEAIHVRDAAQVIVAARESDCHAVIKAINAEQQAEGTKEILGSACRGNFYEVIDVQV
jgi:hypothetical protein